MPDPSLTECIRSIFLQTKPRVSVKDAYALFAGHRRSIDELLAEKAIRTRRRRGAPAIARRDLVALAVEVWSFGVIEDALGDDAARVLPAPIRLHAVTLKLPAYQLAMLEYLANDRATTPSDLVSRQLGDLEGDHFDVLVAGVPGFAEAMNWLQHDRA